MREYTAASIHEVSLRCFFEAVQGRDKGQFISMQSQFLHQHNLKLWQEVLATRILPELSSSGKEWMEQNFPSIP